MESQPASNFLDWVEIKNFKSIKDLRLDCKRVNIFIGKPNVGKSNILEGLGLLGNDYGARKFMEGSVRYKSIKDLFYDNDINSSIFVKSPTRVTAIDKSWAKQITTDDKGNIIYETPEFKLMYGVFEGNTNDRGNQINQNNNFTQSNIAYYITPEGKAERLENKTITDRSLLSGLIFVKKYDYTNLNEFNSLFQDYLLPPHGKNLYQSIKRNIDLLNDIAQLFDQQGLEFVMSESEQVFLCQKRKNHQVWQYPYFSIADTFRRFIFYITAIASNDNSVIIFEEPEVHSFPPYTQELAYRMIYDEKNQYFISTHSPYMLHPFIEKMDYKDLNIFITYYEDYQTKVRALTEEELTDILDYSTNVFFNLRKFEPNA